MHVLLNTDNHITGTENLTSHVESVVKDALGRFGDRITRVEVHLTDVNSSNKSSQDDKRCVMEARIAGLPPITVSSEGATLDQALDSAAEKLEKTLDRKLGRLSDHKGRVSFGGEQLEP